MAQSEKREFQTEVNQLLHLMVHSLYSNKEIFLRELISNASDALDKLRFEAISNEKLKSDAEEFAIWVDYNKDTNTLSIKDNGIGMTKDEVISNIGTIANSGTKKFIESLTGDQAKDSHLIGQFGVGFYSSFIVADKVTLKTRKAGTSSAICWESSGEGGYTLEPTKLESCGTVVTLQLKEDCKEFLENYRLRTVITTYSNHINFPIYLRKEPSEEKPDKDEKKTVEVVENNEEAKSQEATDEAKTKDWEKVNSASALWTKPKSELKDKDYQEFYKSFCMDYQDAMLFSHNRVEGTSEYISLLYIPQKAPFDLWDRDRRYGLKLYVKRVFIMENAESFLPNYLRFVRGVIDSNDLPLNVSREILQNNKMVENIKSGCTSRVLKMLSDLAGEEDKSKYQSFWQEFGQVLKEGIVEDFANKEKVAKLLRFATTNSGEQNVSLDAYIEKFKDGQDSIYYINGETYESAVNSSHLEAFKKAGIEVLVLFDKIDQWVVSHLNEYQKKTLKPVTKGELDDFLKNQFASTDKGKAKDKTSTEEKDTLIKDLEEILKDSVKSVRTTSRLTDSPACLVYDSTDMDAGMQKILQQMGQKVPETTPILEVNAEHPLVKKIKSFKNKDAMKPWANVLFNQAKLTSGMSIDNPTEFVKQMNELLVK